MGLYLESNMDRFGAFWNILRIANSIAFSVIIERMSDTETLKTFLAVIENNSFSGAARQRDMTAASVTRSISGLERRLGVQLLLRTTRRVSLTAAGALYAARVAPLVAAFDNAEEEVRDHHGVTAGLIRVSAPMSLGYRMLPDVISQFRALYPDTRVSFNLTDGFVDILGEEHDLAIRISEPPTDKSTIWRKLCAMPRVLVTSDTYLKEVGHPKTPEDLEQMNCLAFSHDGGSEYWALSNGVVSRSVKAGGKVSSNSGDLISRLLLNHEGVAMLPIFLVQDHLRSGELVQILPDWKPPEIWLTLYYPPYEQLPMRVKTFSDFFEIYANERYEGRS
jgi:DNA-binding transcriptional LysR family regulator